MDSSKWHLLCLIISCTITSYVSFIFLGGNLLYSSPPPDLKGNSDIDVTKKQLWAKQSHGILTDGSLGDINTKTVGTYGKKIFGYFNHQYE